MVFEFIYFILATILLVIATPFLLLQAFFLNPQKYKKSILSRFFLWNNPKFKHTNSIWFHTCSMGETKAIKPILEKLIQYNHTINISVITNTGYKEALNYKNCEVRYLPFEIFLPFWITKQKALIVLEAELWYALFAFSKKQNIPTILINARISDKSYKSYLKYKFLYQKIFNNIDKIFAQTIEDKKRLESLGAKNIEVIGNIKLAKLPTITKQLTKPNSTIITAGSTHKEEEKLILTSFINASLSNTKLIIVPRHPERFNEVYDLIQNLSQNKFTYHRYSLEKHFNSDIILVDTLGELVNIFAISDIVILGGAFANIGGHNPIEPAYFKTKLISGKNIFNQKALFECVKNYYLIDPNELEQYLIQHKNLKNSTLTTSQADIIPIIKYISEI